MHAGISTGKRLWESGVRDLVILEATERVGGRMHKHNFGGLNVEIGANWVEGVGGDGLMPVRELGGEYFHYDEAGRRLIGESSGDVYALGQRLRLKLADANPVSGALRFDLPGGGGGGYAPSPGRNDRGGKAKAPRVLKRRGRPGNLRHQNRKK